MKGALYLVFLATGLSAQVPVPVRITVNWPGRDIVKDKYGSLRKSVTFGEVVGCNLSDQPVTFGEGDVVQALRLNGLQAFSVRDAIATVGHAQANSTFARILTYGGAGVKTIIEAKAVGSIGFSSQTGAVLVGIALLSDIALRNVSGALTVQQLLTYSTDGLQETMQIQAGRCTRPGSVLFGAPVMPGPTSFTIQVHP